MDIISLVKAVILGLVEGATEFIPVSSTGHLILAQNWLRYTGEKANTFTVVIQLGAILAVVWVYREKLFKVAWTLPTSKKSQMLVLNLILATLPAVIIGLPTDEWVEANFFKPVPVAIALVLGGVAIILVERLAKRPTVNEIDDIPITKALGIGAIQVLAMLFPGISRSGATIMGGMGLGLSRVTATEFSFFLAIPAMFGATAIKLLKIWDTLTLSDIPVFGVGTVVAFMSALFVIRALIGFVSRSSFIPFAWYRIIFGIAVLFLYWGSGSFF